MNIEEMKEKEARCWECKGKPDYIYFTKDTGKVLSVICKKCREAFEAAIQALGSSISEECEH